MTDEKKKSDKPEQEKKPDFYYVSNPNAMQDGQPNRFLVKNTGSSVYIQPVWR